MKALIIYGGNRGTTAAIAEAIAGGLNEAGAEASAIRIDSLGVTPARIAAADLLGIGSPVYFLREPVYLTRFISELPPLQGKKAFVYCTTGMDRVGETLVRMCDELRGRGAEVVGAEFYRSAMSYLPHRVRGLGNGEGLPGELELNAAEDFGRKLAAEADHAPVEFAPVPWLARQKARLLANRRLRGAFFPSVRLDPSICTGYGSCISRCKFDALVRDEEVEDAIPIISQACEQCMECIDSCPKSAIVSSSRLKEWISTLSYRLGVH
jgi:ferredoxin/flavodoxin